MKKIILTNFGCLVAINFAIAYTGITFTDITMPVSGIFHLKLEKRKHKLLEQILLLFLSRLRLKIHILLLKILTINI